MLPPEIAKRFRVEHGASFRLSSIDPADTAGLSIDKGDAKEILEACTSKMRKLQERLYADGRWSLLIILQAMDAAGKDSAIEHIFSGINPQGCDVTSFKVPSATELNHDFLWRTTCALPEKGRIGIFNRSYYEEVLVVRVHPELLEKQKLPNGTPGDSFWEDRFDSISSFEKHMARNGTAILKFFLHVSKDEQRRRFLDRIEEPDKRWKFAEGDLTERKLWDDYMAAYEDAIRNTAKPHAPWHVVPADNKWFSRLVIASAIVGKLEEINPQFPTVAPEMKAIMEEARKELKREDDERDSKRKKSDK